MINFRTIDPQTGFLLPPSADERLPDTRDRRGGLRGRLSLGRRGRRDGEKSALADYGSTNSLGGSGDKARRVLSTPTIRRIA